MSSEVPKIERPIFIVGLNKSGTSLLYLILSRHPELSAVKAIPRPVDPPGKSKTVSSAMLQMADYGIGEGQKIPELPVKLRPNAGSGRWAHPDYIELYRLTETDVETGDRERIESAYRKWMTDPRRRLCEKSPPNLLRTRYLSRVFPECTILAIIRNPLANVAANGKKRTKWGGVAVQAAHWAGAHQAFLDDLPHLRRVQAIRMDDLVAHPAATLKRLAEFCGIAYDASLLHHDRIDAKIDEALIALLSAEEKQLVNTVCGPVYDALQDWMGRCDTEPIVSAADAANNRLDVTS